MAKNIKQRFVQARLKETGKEATPEQRAKFRQRFEVLASTKEGRTRIAQVVAPKADAKTRAALKKTLIPQSGTGKVDTGGTGSGSGSGSTTGKSDKAFPNLKQDFLNLQTGSSSTTSTTSTTLPKVVVTPTTLPSNTTPTTMVKNNTLTSSTSTTSTLPVDRISPPSSPPTTVFTNNASSAVVPSAPITSKSSPTQLVYGPQALYYPEKFRNIQGATKPGKVTAYPSYTATPSAKKTNNLPPGVFENFTPKGVPSSKKTSKTK